MLVYHTCMYTCACEEHWVLYSDIENENAVAIDYKFKLTFPVFSK